MKKTKYYINGISLRKYCRDEDIPYGTVQRRIVRGMTVEEALNYDFKKRPANSYRQIYGFNRADKIWLYKRKYGYSEKEAIIRSMTKTELIEACKILCRIAKRVRPGLIEKKYKEFLDD